MIKPTELLEDLCVSRIVSDNALISILRANMLTTRNEVNEVAGMIKPAYVFLLLVNMADLEPNVCMGERAGRVPENAIETVEGVFVLSLLLVNNTQSKKNFISFIEI